MTLFAADSAIALMRGFTVTFTVAFFPVPSFAVTVIFAVPDAMALITPPELTVATRLFDDAYATLFVVAVFGATDALIAEV